MNDRLSHARGWLAKADSDLAAARLLLEARGPFDVTCYHAQQAAEKMLKGLLALGQRPIPRTHNLEELQAECAGVHPIVGNELRVLELSDLTPYAVESRYDLEFWPDESAARAAVATAERLRAVVAPVVG